MNLTDRISRATASIALGLGVMSVPMSSLAANALEVECERLWITDTGALMSPKVNAGPAALLRQWSAREPECGSTAIYWGRMSMAQLLANDIPGAKKSLARAPASEPDYRYAVDMAVAQIVVQERTSDPAPLTPEDIAKFEVAYAGVVAKHPKWPTGYALLGGMQTLLGKHAQALQNLAVAEKGNAYELWGVYRNQTISLSALGKHEEALAAADKAVENNRAVLSDAPFAYAVAISHAALGYLDDADDTLKVILTRRPEVRNDPDFQRAVAYCRAQRQRLTKK